MSIIDDIERFRAEWNDTGDRVLVHTSGSTGAPKPFWASKEKMSNSARMTCDYLGLKPGDTALLCMPMKYIAGKMVVVRSIVRELELIAVEPSGHPLAETDRHLTFAAMTPMQVYNTLQIDEERERLSRIDNLIIGGGTIDPKMEAVLKDMPNKIYSTYGMTETLSHIAMRRVNGEAASKWYTPLPHVGIGLSSEGTLTIDAPLLSDTHLTTNDIAEINDRGDFSIIGRRDNTINSGGVKIQIEEAEERLRAYLNDTIAVTSIADEKFGEALVLITETADETTAIEACRQAWPKLWQPKHIYNAAIPMTATNKPDRAGIKRLAESLSKTRGQ